MRSLLFTLAFASLIGCAVDEGDFGSTSQSIVVNNRIAANRIAANRIAANRIAANRIAANRIAANRLTLSPAGDDLIETADGREVLTYIVSCALKEGTVLVGTDSNGVEYEFFGEVGLAPQWIDHPLNNRGKGWISACLFARVNNHDVAVPVSLRGPSHALATTADELANWTIQEGAFYGQYFLPITQPIAWYACSGHDAPLALPEERDCTMPDPAHPGLTLCGFNYAGDCGDYAPPETPTACRRVHPLGGYYMDCADHAVFVAHHHDVGDDDFDGDQDDHGYGHGNDVFRQVITTYVHP